MTGFLLMLTRYMYIHSLLCICVIVYAVIVYVIFYLSGQHSVVAGQIQLWSDKVQAAVK